MALAPRPPLMSRPRLQILISPRSLDLDQRGAERLSRKGACSCTTGLVIFVRVIGVVVVRDRLLGQRGTRRRSFLYSLVISVFPQMDPRPSSSPPRWTHGRRLPLEMAEKLNATELTYLNTYNDILDNYMASWHRDNSAVQLDTDQKIFDSHRVFVVCLEGDGTDEIMTADGRSCKLRKGARFGLLCQDAEVMEREGVVAIEESKKGTTRKLTYEVDRNIESMGTRARR